MITEIDHVQLAMPAGGEAAAGYEVIEDPVPFEGRAHCYVNDPFGNRIELIPE